MRRRLAAASVLALTLTGTAACGSDSDSSSGGEGGSIEGLTVTGEFGEEPTIEVDGLDVSDVESAVAIEGDGAEMTEESAALYRFVIANGETGETVASNYQDNAPQQLVMSQEAEVVTSSVEGETIGSRILLAMPVTELLGEQGAPQVGLGPDDDLVMVIDLVEEAEGPLTGPQGEELEPPADAPKVVEEDGVVTGLEVPDGEQPTEFEAITLVEGDGETVQKGDSIVVNYIGARWETAGEPFDSSFERGEPASFQLTEGGLIDGWVKGLDGVTVGSRVLLVIPPELGYGEEGNPSIDVTGDDTMVFLIDVLGVEG